MSAGKTTEKVVPGMMFKRAIFSPPVGEAPPRPSPTFIFALGVISRVEGIRLGVLGACLGRLGAHAGRVPGGLGWVWERFGAVWGGPGVGGSGVTFASRESPLIK